MQEQPTTSKTCLAPPCDNPLDPHGIKTPSALARAKYCSRSCRQKTRIAQQPPEQRLAFHGLDRPKVCKECGASYVATSARQKWCIECVPDRGARHILTRYGLTRAAYEQMLAQQDGVCAICKTRAGTVVDHCHATGKTRAILCYGCNNALGAFMDNPEIIRSAAEYVERHDKALPGG